MTNSVRSFRTAANAAKGLLFAALVLSLWILPTPVLASGVQMIPPVTEGTVTVCPSGTTRMLTWDGVNPLSCSNELMVSGGKVGIGTTTPQGTLDVAGEVKIGITGTGCASTNAGAVRYNTSKNIFEGCNGITWENMTGGSYSAGGIDVVDEEGPGTFAYCRNGWGAAACDGFGNVTCTQGNAQVTTDSHDDISPAEVPPTSQVSVATMVSVGAQVGHYDCIVN